jgi:hypothetical protein
VGVVDLPYQGNQMPTMANVNAIAVDMRSHTKHRQFIYTKLKLNLTPYALKIKIPFTQIA